MNVQLSLGGGPTKEKGVEKKKKEKINYLNSGALVETSKKRQHPLVFQEEETFVSVRLKPLETC